MRQITALDELEDPTPPAPLPLIRFCSRPGCRQRAGSGGRYCNGCNAAAVRQWRSDHKREVAVRRRDAAELRDEATRARDSARAKLAMAIRRGKLTRGQCESCGSGEVIALMADPARPFDVVWVCGADRQAEIERSKSDQNRLIAATAQSDWERHRAEALAAIALLPLVIQAQFAAIAVRGPGGLRLSPNAPLYIMRLVQAYRAFVASSG